MGTSTPRSRPGRLVTSSAVLAAAVLLAAVLLPAGGPASAAASLTKAKVQQIATQVALKTVREQARRRPPSSTGPGTARTSRPPRWRGTPRCWSTR